MPSSFELSNNSTSIMANTVLVYPGGHVSIGDVEIGQNRIVYVRPTSEGVAILRFEQRKRIISFPARYISPEFPQKCRITITAIGIGRLCRPFLL